MKKSRIGYLVAIIIVLSGCGLSNMANKYDTVTYKVNPSILEVHGGKINLKLNANFPQKYFAKNVVVDFTPVLVYPGGEKSFKTISMQGENAIGGEKTIFYENGGKFSYEDLIKYTPEMKNSILELRAIGKERNQLRSEEQRKPLGPVKIATGVITTSERVQNNETIVDIHVKSSKLKPFKIPKKLYVTCVDEFPIIFCLASIIPGISIIEVNSENLMNKESNRVLEIKKILQQIGIKCIVKKDRIKIYGKTNLNTHKKLINVSGVLDHRILMSSSILSLLTGIKSNLKNFEQVSSSCPNFLSTIKKLGGKFEVKKIS